MDDHIEFMKSLPPGPFHAHGRPPVPFFDRDDVGCALILLALTVPALIARRVQLALRRR